MKVSEEQRRELFERLRVHLDEETANLLLEVTMPANIELATRSDTQELRAEMLLRFAQVDGRINEIDAKVDRLDAKIDRLDVKLTSRLFKVVIPVLVASNLLVVAVATWIGIAAGGTPSRELAFARIRARAEGTRLAAETLGV